MSANSKKILIIGSANYDTSKEGIRIECIPWQKLSGLQNVSDYDLLLVNLLCLRLDTQVKLQSGPVGPLTDDLKRTDAGSQIALCPGLND